MKKTSIPMIFSAALLILAVIAGCRPAQQAQDTVDTLSECDRMSEGGRKVMCYAMAANKIEMCEGVIGRFRDSCVLALAETVYDKEKVSYCSLAEAEGNKKICEALLMEDPQKCFNWEQGSGTGAGISIRDCIGLVARKNKDPSVCDTFVQRAPELHNLCGLTSDCEGMFVAGSLENAEQCKSNIG